MLNKSRRRGDDISNFKQIRLRNGSTHVAEHFKNILGIIKLLHLILRKICIGTGITDHAENCKHHTELTGHLTNGRLFMKQFTLHIITQLRFQFTHQPFICDLLFDPVIQDKISRRLKVVTAKSLVDPSGNILHTIICLGCLRQGFATCDVHPFGRGVLGGSRKNLQFKIDTLRAAPLGITADIASGE